MTGVPFHSMSRFLPLLLSASLLVSALSAAERPLEPPGPKEKWLSLAVEEFDIISSVSPSETTSIARELLRMRDAVGKVTRLNVRTSGRIKVLVFQERRFGPYRDAALQRKMEDTSGVYISGDGGNFILLESQPGGDVDRTIYHELTHHFARNTAAQLPLWFNEGLAEFYSTFKTSGSDVHIGKPIAEHVQWLREETLIPLSELLATTTDSPIYNEGLRQGVFYAESWALVHYLMTGSEPRRKALGRFLNLVDDGEPVEKAFREAFAITYAQLEKDLRAYVQQRAFSYTKYSLGDIGLRELPVPVAMSRDALLFELADLYTSTGNMEVAGRFLSETLKVNANHAGAHAGMGRVLERAGHRSDADAAYARAMSLGSGDARVYLRYGLSVLNRLAETSGRASGPELLKAREALQRSVELDSASARAWAALGSTYVGAGEDAAPGITALEKSLALEPGDPHAAFYLLQLYANAGRGEDAARLLPIVATAPDRAMVAMSRNALVVADVRRAEALARQGKNDEAISIAESALGRATDPELKKYLKSFVEDLRGIEAEKKGIASLNQALTLANAGKHAEAVAILDELIPTIADPELAGKAKKFRTEIAGRIRRR
jgi:tetratricopeptide (TPR) repeat protein